MTHRCAVAAVLWLGSSLICGRPSAHVAAAPGGARTSASIQNAQGAGPCSPGFVSRANELLATYLEQSKAPGVAVAFYDDGKTCELVAGNLGGPGSSPVTGDTLFAMGSVQKVFSSTLLASEIAQGKVAITDPAATYLVSADGRALRPGAAFSRITLQQLATHTASLPESPTHATERVGVSLYQDKPMPASVMTFLDSWVPPYPPGTRYKYSNLGFVLLGHVATAIARKPYSALLAEVVTGPIGMPHTAAAVCNSPKPSCAEGHDESGRRATETPVGLWTSARDLERFLEANLGVLEMPDLQSRAIALTHQELFRENDNHAVGMAWEIWHSGDALLMSKNGDGAGFTSWLAFQPRRRRGVALLSNGAGKPWPAELGQELLKLAGGSWSTSY